jgi:hypothetical protein
VHQQPASGHQFWQKFLQPAIGSWAPVAGRHDTHQVRRSVFTAPVNALVIRPNNGELLRVEDPPANVVAVAGDHSPTPRDPVGRTRCAGEKEGHTGDPVASAVAAAT